MRSVSVLRRGPIAVGVPAPRAQSASESTHSGPRLADGERAFHHAVLTAITNGAPAALVAMDDTGTAGADGTMGDFLDAAGATADACSFEVVSQQAEGGMVLLTHSWSRRALRRRVARLEAHLAATRTARPVRIAYAVLPTGGAARTDAAQLVHSVLAPAEGQLAA